VTTETTDDVPEAINAQATRGLRWSLLGNMAMKVASFGMAIVLARLLTPADFGDYAVALAATQFVMHVNDVGLIAGTVEPTTGRVKRGKTVKIAVLDQRLAELDEIAHLRESAVIADQRAAYVSGGVELSPGQLLER